MTARATEIYRVPGRTAIRYLEFLPMVVPGTVFAMGFQVTLIRIGLNDTMTGVVLVHLVCCLPYAYAIMSDMTAAAGNALEEQAQVLGAPAGRAFLDVTLPQLLPGILSSFCMSFIISYSQYFTTLLAGGGKIKTIALVLVPYIQSGDRALSSVYSVVFVGSALLVFAVFESILKKMNRNLQA
jgi:putative spermidine/putrescine transport system permease protein